MPKKKSKKAKLKAQKIKKSSGSTSSALTSYDSLQGYLKKIENFDVLTPEEEQKWAMEYYENKDPQAAYRLTVHNLRLVVKIALEYRRAWSNILDLIQEGNIGLMTAIQKFDPYRQNRLSTYASWWIRAYILKFVMNNWRLIKIGNTQAERKLFYNLKKEQDKLIAEGFNPGPKLLAERLNVKEEDVVEMSRRLGTSELSIDGKPTSFGQDGSEGRTLAEVLPADQADLEEIFADQEIKTLIKDVTEHIREHLKPREIMLLDRRILADEPMTLQEIGEQFGVSRERIRQIEARVLKKLGEYIREKYPDVAEKFEA